MAEPVRDIVPVDHVELPITRWLWQHVKVLRTLIACSGWRQRKRDIEASTNIAQGDGEGLMPAYL